MKISTHPVVGKCLLAAHRKKMPFLDLYDVVSITRRVFPINASAGSK